MCGVECSGGVRGVVGQGGVGPWGLGMWGGAQVLPWKFEAQRGCPPEGQLSHNVTARPAPKHQQTIKTCLNTNFGFWKLIQNPGIYELRTFLGVLWVQHCIRPF